MCLFDVFMVILEMPKFGEMSVIGFAFLLGVIVGWVWKPRWVSLGNCNFGLIPSLVKAFGSTSVQSLDFRKVRAPSLGDCVLVNVLEKEEVSVPAIDDSVCSSSKLRGEESVLVTNEDLEHLCHLVEKKDGGPSWKHIMNRSAHDMSYQAWMREPEVGPPQYCSRTVYEDTTPELMRDFFWDDEFRLKWDDMLVHATVLEECTTTGTLIVHWIRKFPFFCSDREYIIGRRMWDSGTSYYAVTKGVPCHSIPRRDKPRRVDLYYSSWYIQAVESKKEIGQMSACEVILFHHEDMGIPWEIAKFGVRQGMWGAVKNIERGFRAYQMHRASGAPLSHHAIMAQIITKVDLNYLNILEGEDKDSMETQILDSSSLEKPKGINIPKILIVGGLVVVACTLDRGFLTKTLIFGVAKRFGNMGRRAFPRSH